MSQNIEKNRTKIVQIITEFVQPKQIILFGSRASGQAHHYSDYDIALVGVSIDHRTERCLKEALDDRLSVFIVDLINLDKVDTAFKELGLQNGVILYES